MTIVSEITISVCDRDGRAAENLKALISMQVAPTTLSQKFDVLFVCWCFPLVIQNVLVTYKSSRNVLP